MKNAIKSRVPVPKPVETELLLLSSRRCCLCYGLEQNLKEKRGQIAHLDHDNSNNKIDNLAWLCRKHHDKYDGKTIQSKNYQISEVKKYRKALFEEILRMKASLKEMNIKPTKNDIEPIDKESYYNRFSSKYIGRKKNVEYVLDFLNDPDQHFMLLYGVGGMGKSHLISECRKIFTHPKLKHIECKSHFKLKSLFETCNIDYPEQLDYSEEGEMYFINELMNNNICLILDDFYEIIDSKIRGMLPKLASIPKGKILLVSRAVPKELESIGLNFKKYFLPPLNEPNFNKFLLNYINSKAINLSLFEDDLKKIFGKTQGYPLGGELIIDLLNLRQNLDNILKDLPKFEAKLDPEGKKFSGKLLNNIFKKGNEQEIRFLCEFSALFGSSPIELIEILPSYDLKNFNTLINRRSFIYLDTNNEFNSHPMIKDYAYEKLTNKETIHLTLGRYFEDKLFASSDLNTNLLESAILHFRRVGINELHRFGQRIDWKFNIRNVKTLIEENVKDTIRNYKNLLEVYPRKMAYYNELGMAYRLNNQKQLAIDTFLEAEKIEQTDVQILNELGITYRENNQHQKAIDTFLKAEKIEPTDVQILNELGITYRKINQHQKAIETFLKAIEIDSKHLPSYNELGITYREYNQHQKAIETFLKAIEIDSKNLPSYNELGITYREYNQHQKAIETFLKAIEIDSKNLPSYNELGITYREYNQHQKAIETFLKAIEIDSKNLPSYNELGITYREYNQHQKAIETFLKAIEIDSKNLPSYNELGITYREYNQHQKAIETFLKAIEIDSKHLPSYNELGITYREYNQHQKAIETFLKAIEIDSKNLPSYNELGITYREYNQHQKAIETFLKAIEIDSKHLPSYNELGITYREYNQHQKAIETFLKAIEIDSKNLPSYNELGITYREYNQHQKAIETFLKAIEIDSKHLPSYNELGITYREYNQHQKAIETFLKAIEIDSKHLPSYNELGITYREYGKYKEAIAICEKAIKINRNQKQLYLNLLQIYIFFKPDKTKAREYFNILDLFPRINSSIKNFKDYRKIIISLDEIWGLSFDDVKKYDRYLYLAIQYKAYQTILPLLYKLNEKFPNTIKNISRLGKTLSNQVDTQNDAWYFLNEAITLFKEAYFKEDDENEKLKLRMHYEEHILYYLNNLFNNEQKEKLESEIERYDENIKHIPKYHCFLARYYEFLDKSEEEVIGSYEIAFNLSLTNEERLKSVEELLNYLTNTNNEKYLFKIQELKKNISFLLDLINSKALNTQNIFLT